MIKLFQILTLLCLFSCKAQDCENLPKTYTSYSEAVSTITSASFTIEDSVDTSSSSWIAGAGFYSCDSVEGYLILETSKKNYVFKEVPLSIWKEFKIASSFGTYYNSYIRGKYQLAI